MAPAPCGASRPSLTRRRIGCARGARDAHPALPPAEVEWDGERLEAALPGNQGRLLFAYLVLHRDRTVRRDELLEVLWSGEPAPQSADARAVRPALAPAQGARVRAAERPRRALARPAAGGLGRLGGGVRRPARGARRGRRRTLAGRVDRRPGAALEIADGGLLPGLEARWIDEKRARARRPAPRAAGARSPPAACGSAAPSSPHAEQAARAAVEAAPFRESARAALIEVLRARGNVADALRAFEDARTLLREELGRDARPAAARAASAAAALRAATVARRPRCPTAWRRRWRRRSSAGGSRSPGCRRSCAAPARVRRRSSS